MALPLTIYTFGTSLAKRSERLVIRESGAEPIEVPFFRISEIVLAQRGTSLSTDVIREACQRGIRILFLADAGRPYAVLSSPELQATVATRREQLRAFDDARGAAFAGAVVRAKIRNQRNLVTYFARRFEEREPERFAALQRFADMLDAAAREAKAVKGNTVDAVRGRLMGIEGSAGRVYWQAVGELLRDRVDFPGRTGRGAVDGVNALLNYGYGILSGTLWGAALNAGLDPFAGFLHVDRPGKPSLVLDMEEEYRQPIVDRVIFAAIDRGFSIRMEGNRLSVDTRKEIAARVIERLDGREGSDNRLVRALVQSQARRLAAFLAGRAKTYRPLALRW